MGRCGTFRSRWEAWKLACQSAVQMIMWWTRTIYRVTLDFSGGGGETAWNVNKACCFPSVYLNAFVHWGYLQGRSLRGTRPSHAVLFPCHSLIQNILLANGKVGLSPYIYYDTSYGPHLKKISESPPFPASSQNFQPLRREDDVQHSLCGHLNLTSFPEY